MAKVSTLAFGYIYYNVIIAAISFWKLLTMPILNMNVGAHVSNYNRANDVAVCVATADVNVTKIVRYVRAAFS